MSEATNYSELVREAFIDPIRSVMIVDDDYPTWEEILDGSRWNRDENNNLLSPVKPKGWWTDANGPHEVLKQFRNRNKGLMIDIHDGRHPDNVEPKKIASYLHQSDLLVLDYQLEGEAAGGERAQELAQHLLNQNHFNLIVVHTNKNDLFEPFSGILLRLLTVCASQEAHADMVEQGKDSIEETGDDDLADNLRNEFTSLHYLTVRHPTSGKRTLGHLIRGTFSFSAINRLLTDAGIEKPKMRGVLYWLTQDFERRFSASFAQENSAGVSWSMKPDCFWIRTDRGFIAFANKKTTPDVIACLQTALEDWQPTPSRLLSAKFRHAIDEFGVVAEDKTLSKKHVYAKFYDEIKSAKEEERGALLDDHVVRQTERLTAEIQENVRDFGLAVRNADEGTGTAFDLSEHYGVDLSNDSEKMRAVNHYNSYVSCVPVHGYHLTCGHIFEFNDAKWVVASPACDMVPGQRRMGFIDVNESYRPFVALKLYKNSNSLNDDEINSGSLLFLEEGDDVSVYCTFAKSGATPGQAPKMTWCNFMASNDGVLENNNTFQILSIDASKNTVEASKAAVRVVAQLRQEFTLNLINRLGSTMTRVGLSYTGSN